MSFFFYILNNIDSFIESALKRHKVLDADLKEKCIIYRKNSSSLNRLRATRNKIKLSATDAQTKTSSFLMHAQLSNDISNLNIEQKALEYYLEQQFQKLPNILDIDVDDTNFVVKQNANITLEVNSQHTSMSFWDRYICKDKGPYMSGTKFAVLSAEGSLIMRRLQNIMIANAEKHLYSELYLPVMVNRTALQNASHMYFFEDEIFALKDDNKYLIPTSEVTILNFHAQEKLNDIKRYFCISNCFRREAGAHGKANFSIQRLHQFSKLELFSFCRLSDSANELERMISTATILLDALQIPYRIIRNAIEDTSPQACKTFDIEVWCPSFGWMEISSCSNVTHFQSSRANIKFEDNYAATLNGTAVACERLFISFLDNHGGITDTLLSKIEQALVQI